jgi:hypothetical protein
MQGSRGIPPSGIRIPFLPTQQSAGAAAVDGDSAATSTPGLFAAGMGGSQLGTQDHRNQFIARVGLQNAGRYEGFCNFISHQLIARLRLTIERQIEHHQAYTRFMDKNPLLNRQNIDSVASYYHSLSQVNTRGGDRQDFVRRNTANFRDASHDQSNNSSIINLYLKKNKGADDVLRCTTSLLHKTSCTPDDAARLIHNIQQAQIPLDTITYNAAITVCANAIKHATTQAEANQIFTQFNALLAGMQQAQIPLNTITYSAAITVCANAIKQKVNIISIKRTSESLQSGITSMNNEQLNGRYRRIKIIIDTISSDSGVASRDVDIDELLREINDTVFS